MLGMQALVIRPEKQASVVEVKQPDLRPDYVKVKVTAIALNPRPVVGCDFAGRVTDIGNEVKTSVTRGDHIYGMVAGSNDVNHEDGCFAEYCVVKDGIFSRVPSTLTDEAASTLGVGLMTCGQGLYQSLELPWPNEPTKTPFPILIYGGSTSTGMLAIQFAKLSGLTVVTTASKQNFQILKDFGADEVFDYHDPQCGAKIREYTKDKLYYVFDCFSEKDSMQISSDALSSTAPSTGLHCSMLLPFQSFPREDVKTRVTMAFTGLGEATEKVGRKVPAMPDHYRFSKGFMAVAGQLLEEGKLKPANFVVKEGGLGGVLDGLQELREGKVSGQKLLLAEGRESGSSNTTSMATLMVGNLLRTPFAIRHEKLPVQVLMLIPGFVFADCCRTFLVGLNSSAPSTAFPEINDEFSIPDDGFETSFFMISSWNIAAGVFPMITLSLMDSYGTYHIYLVSHLLFFIFVLPQALAPNFATLVVVRIFAGAFGGTLQNGAEAVIANLFHAREERLLAVTLYILSFVGGVTLGPVQGAIVHVLNWRWVFWIQLILYGAMLPVTVFGLRETRGSVIETKLNKFAGQSLKQVSSANGLATGEGMAETLLRSGKLLTTEFIVFSFMLWCAFSYGLIFISTESVGVVYGSTFGFEPFQVGLVQITMFVGEILGAMACIYSQRLYIIPTAPDDPEKPILKQANYGKHVAADSKARSSSSSTNLLEKELYLCVPATIIGLSGGLFLYGWTGFEGSLPWIAPIIGLALQGFAVQVILTGSTIYLTECYNIYAASAIAGITIGENMFAAFLPLASLPMYRNLGCQWASSLLAFVGLALVLPPIALIIKGSGIRAKSKAIQELSRRKDQR